LDTHFASSVLAGFLSASIVHDIATGRGWCTGGGRQTAFYNTFEFLALGKHPGDDSKRSAADLEERRQAKKESNSSGIKMTFTERYVQRLARWQEQKRDARRHKTHRRRSNHKLWAYWRSVAQERQQAAWQRSCELGFLQCRPVDSNVLVPRWRDRCKELGMTVVFLVERTEYAEVHLELAEGIRFTTQGTEELQKIP
jgi:hypothetical protein